MSHRLLIYILLSVAVFIASSCDFTDEIEPTLPPIELPEVQIVSGPITNDTVRTTSASFQWEGKNNLIKEFSYRFAPVQNIDQKSWSDWLSGKSINFDYIDQGEYAFEVKGRYKPKIDGQAIRRNFSVDVPGPGMLIKPLKVDVGLGKEFTVSVIADDVGDLMLAHVILKFDPLLLKVLEVNPSAAIKNRNLLAFYKTINNGLIDINLSVIGMKQSGTNETIDIAVVKFQSKSSGSAKIEFDEKSELRDSKNKTIDTNYHKKGGIVNITS
jgi:hypothetical protein